MVRNDAARNIFPDQDASIALPPSLFAELRNATETGIGFTFYETSALFPLPDSSPSNLSVGSHVIGAFVAGQSISNLSDPVTIFLRLTQPVRMLCIVTVLNIHTVSYIYVVELTSNLSMQNSTNLRCASWNFTAAGNQH